MLSKLEIVVSVVVVLGIASAASAASKHPVRSPDQTSQGAARASNAAAAPAEFGKFRNAVEFNSAAYDYYTPRHETYMWIQDKGYRRSQ